MNHRLASSSHPILEAPALTGFESSLRLRAPLTRADRLVPWLVFLVGSIISLWLAFGMSRRAEQNQVREFESIADQRYQELKGDVHLALESLRPLRMLFEASERVERTEFARFAQELLKRQPSLEAVAWVPFVDGSDRAAFERSTAAEGFPGFAITHGGAQIGYTPAPPRDNYFPIKYIEPIDKARVILGSDLGQTRSQFHAIIRAFDGADVAVTTPFQFFFLPAQPVGFLAFLSRTETTKSSDYGPSEQGVVMGAFNSATLLDHYTHVDDAGNRAIRFRIYDRTYGDLQSPFFGSAPVTPEEPGSDSLVATRKLLIGGRQWEVVASSPRRAWHASQSAPIALALAGLAVTSLLAAFMSGRVSRRRAEEHVQLLTATLREANVSLEASRHRLQTLFDAAIDPLWDWDVLADRTRSSLSWLTLVGFTPGAVDAASVIWSDRLHPDDKPRVWDALDRCLRGETAYYDAQYRLRHESRGWIHVRSRGAVVERDAEGRATRMVGNLSDMTGILLAQAAVRDSEERLRQLVDNVDSVFWMVSLDTRRVIYVSPAFEYIWGRPTSDFTEDRVHWIDTIHPDDRAMAEAAFSSWLARPDSARYDVVYRVLRPDNSVRWVRDRGFVVHDERGAAYRIAGFAEDVSARVLSEAALVNSEQRLSGLFEQAAVGIAETDLSGRFRLVNQRFGDILGISLDQLLTKSFVDVAHPEEQNKARALHDRLLKGEVDGYAAQHRLVRGDGTECWCEVALSVVRDAQGRATSFTAVIQDVTARRAAEEFARETTERHRLALEAIAGIVYEIDLINMRLSRSSGVDRILGYLPSDYSEETLGWASFIHEDDMPEVRARFQKACDEGQNYSIEYRARHKDGHYVYLLGRGIIVRDADGRAVRAVGCTMDVSQLRQAQIALRTAEDRTRAILRAIPDHLFHVDREGRYLGFHSNRPHELFVPPEQFLGRTVSEAVPPDLAEKSMELLDRLFLTGEPQSFDGCRLRDGVLTYTEYRLVPASENEALILVRDITSRKHTEVALRESEERYRALFDRMPEPVLVHHAGAIAMGNQAVATLLGVAHTDQLHQLNFFDSLLPDDRPLSLQHAQNILDTGIAPTPWHARIRQPDGAVRIIEMAASRISFGGRFALLLVARDLTERIRSEELLTQTRDRLHGVLDRLPDIVAYDSSDDRLFVGENIVRLIGRDAASLMNDPSSFRALIHPDDQEHVARCLRQFFTRPVGSNQTLQFRFRRADGVDVWVEDRMTILPSSGPTPRLVGVLIDVTQIKHTEFLLRGMMAERDHRVKNNLASVIAIAEHMYRGATNLAEYHAAIVARIRALSSVHHTLAQTRWKHVEMGSMIRETLAPFEGPTPDSPPRVTIEGKETILPGRMGPPLALTLHELATNAAKHGALSTAAGRIHVSWNLATAQTGHILRLHWREEGGPTVRPPSRRGFGRDMIETGLRHELGATVELLFEPAGFACCIEVPIVPESAPTPGDFEGIVRAAPPIP